MSEVSIVSIVSKINEKRTLKKKNKHKTKRKKIAS